MKKLENLTINRYYTDDWVSYKKHIPAEKHIISKVKTQKIERQKQGVAPIKFSYSY
jgi:IS1 family transposase